MSRITKYTSFEPVNVSVSLSDLSIDNLGEMVTSCERAMAQKMAKLKEIIEPMRVYEHDGALLVMDPYKICPRFAEIASALGFVLNSVDCGKGNSWILTDPIWDALMIMNPDYRLENIKPLETDSQMRRFIEKSAFHTNWDKNATKCINTLAAGGSFSVKGEAIWEDVKDNDKLIRRNNMGERSKEKESLVAGAKKFFGDVRNQLSEVNEEIVNGIASAIDVRASGYGWGVKKEVRGNKIYVYCDLGA